MSLTTLRSVVIAPTVALAIAGLSTLGLIGSASAHDAWVAPVTGPVYPVHFGHKEPQSYAAAKVKVVSVLDAKRGPLANEISRDDKGASVKVNGKPAMFLVEFDNGFYSRVDGKTVNVSKREAPTSTSTRRTAQMGQDHRAVAALDDRAGWSTYRSAACNGCRAKGGQQIHGSCTFRRQTAGGCHGGEQQ